MGSLTDLLYNLRLLELKFDQIAGLRIELYPHFETLKCKFSKNYDIKQIYGLKLKKKSEKKGILYGEWPGGREKWAPRAAHTHNSFSGKYPPGL